MVCASFRTVFHEYFFRLDLVYLADGTVLASATITPVNSDGQPRQNSSPKTVKDLMLNVIEISLMKNAGSQNPHNPPTSGIAPTISSILNNDSNEVTIVSEYNLNNQHRPQRNDLNIAKLLTPLIGTFFHFPFHVVHAQLLFVSLSNMFVLFDSCWN